MLSSQPTERKDVQGINARMLGDSQRQRSGTTHVLFATAGISEIRWQGAVALKLASVLTELSLQAQAHTSNISASAVSGEEV